MTSAKRKEKKWPGHFNPKPGELEAVWPTVRTETYVEMVFGAIRDGAQTSREIQQKTSLKDHQVGTALADLILWRKRVVSTVDAAADERRYFVTDQESE
jgi:hypothetical protein